MQCSTGCLLSYTPQKASAVQVRHLLHSSAVTGALSDLCTLAPPTPGRSGTALGSLGQATHRILPSLHPWLGATSLSRSAPAGAGRVASQLRARPGAGVSTAMCWEAAGAEALLSLPLYLFLVLFLVISSFSLFPLYHLRRPCLDCEQKLSVGGSFLLEVLLACKAEHF